MPAYMNFSRTRRLPLKHGDAISIKATNNIYLANIVFKIPIKRHTYHS